jgi:hypothetical protein
MPFDLATAQYHLGLLTKDAGMIQTAQDAFTRIGSAHSQERCERSTLQFGAGVDDHE